VSVLGAAVSPEQLLRTMVATVGHELRTPLTSIRGYLETLLEGGLDAATVRRFLETARREALRLGRLVDGMLAFSPLDISHHSPSVSCDASEQVRATVEMLAPLAAQRGVTIDIECCDALAVRIDADAFVHALANLVENAIKHGGAAATIQVRCIGDDQWATISVEDDGAGIDPSHQESIFSYGVSSARSGGSASGIGLAVVRAIAERAGGDVSFEPSPLGGARFVLRLPAG